MPRLSRPARCCPSALAAAVIFGLGLTCLAFAGVAFHLDATHAGRRMAVPGGRPPG